MGVVPKSGQKRKQMHSQRYVMKGLKLQNRKN